MTPAPCDPERGPQDPPADPPETADSTGYDAERVAADAQAADPGLPQGTALLLARESWRHLRAAGPSDPAELARRLLAGHPAAGATAANVVAVAAVRFCAAHGVDPQA